MARNRVSETAARAALLLAGLVLVAACESARESAASFEVVEDGSASTVVNHTPAEPAGSWALAAVPRVQIGEVEGEEPYLFLQIVFARILPGGEIVVVDGGASAVREYSPEGVHIRSQGRPGDGPGEYRNIVQVQRLSGDTMVLVQFPGRYSFVEGDGTFVRNWLPPSLPGPSAFLTSDRMLWTLTSGDSREMGPVTLRRTVVSGTAEEANGDTVAVLDGGEYVRVRSGQVEAKVAVPFAPAGVMVVDPPDRLITSVDGWELVYHDLDAGTERRVRLDRAPRPVTDADWDRAVAASLEQRRTALPGDVLRLWEQALGQAQRPETMPAFDWLLIDDAGDVWAREFVPPYESPAERVWDVLDGSGRWITSVAIPSDFDVLDIGESQVVVGWADPLGVQRIRVYDLVRRR